MKYRKRIYYPNSDKRLLWDRCHKSELLIDNRPVNNQRLTQKNTGR